MAILNMLEKINSTIGGFYRKIMRQFALKNNKIDRFILEFEYYDSNFKSILLEIYDYSTKKFVKCAFLPAEGTFAWRRRRVNIDFKDISLEAGPALIARLSRPAIGGLQPFMLAGVSLLAAVKGENSSCAVARFMPEDNGILKMGFSGPFTTSSKRALAMDSKNPQKPAYIIFDEIAGKIKDSGFEYVPAVSCDLSVIELFTSSCGPSQAAGQEENKSGDLETAASPGSQAAQLVLEEPVMPPAAETPPQPKEEPDLLPVAETPPEVETTQTVETDRPVPEPGSEKPDGSVNYFLINFFSKDDWSALIKRLDPKFAKKIISKADGIIHGEYEIHDIYYKLGDNIDWHDDFNSSRWPAGKSYKNIYADFYECITNGAASGNSARWPLNIQFSKNNEWTLLALAYKFSGDDKYVKKIAGLFKSFKDQNEIGCGINFLSDAASAERLVSWLMCFELAGESHAGLFAEIGFHEYFNRQFDHIYERVVNRPADNARHERVIALSCLYGVLLQVGGRIAPAVAKLFKKLKEELLFQICPDGGHITGSTALQLAIYKSLLFALVVARKASREGSKFAGAAYDDSEFMDAFARMGRYMAALARPNGEAINIADNYLYFYLPFDESGPLDIKPSLQLASYILMDKKMKYLTGANKIIGIAMVFGNEGVEKYNGLLVEAPEAHSARFDQSGYFTFTSPVNSFGESNAAAHLVFDFGGSPRRKEETEKFDFFRHAGLHNIILSHGGANFISDCGPSFFIKNSGINRYIKDISAHNSVVLNKTHFDANCDFRLAESFKRYEDESVCLVSSTHKGYHAAGIEAFVRRTILMVNRDYVLIMDDVFNGRKKPSYADIDVIFHSPPGITIENSMPQLQKNLLIYNSRSSEARLINLTFSAQKISSAIYRASLDPVFGWHSSSASEICESSTVVHSARFAKLPVRIYNLFYMANAEDNAGSLMKKLKMNLNKVNSSIEISHRDYKDSIKINDKFEVDFTRSTVKI